MTDIEVIVDWLWRELGLDHDETFGSDHLDYDGAVKAIEELME